MFRLPLFNMSCREATPLSAEEVVRRLECEALLPLERRQVDVTTETPGAFVVYFFYGGEQGQEGNRFVLTELKGRGEETVLDHGEAFAFCENHDGMGHFICIGKKLGRFEYYCPMPETPMREFMPKHDLLAGRK